jgi:hypothetical protein
VSTSSQAPGVGDVSKQTKEADKNRKEDDKRKEDDPPQVPVEAKPREVVEEDQADSINTDDLFASTLAPVTFDIATPEFIQVRDSAPRESLSTNKDDAEEYKINNESLSINKDDESQKYESNNEEIHSRKVSYDSLAKSIKCPNSYVSHGRRSL